MSAFYYSATLGESLDMLRDLLSQGFRLVPDGTFDEASVPEYCEVDAALAGSLRAGPGFLLAGDYTRFPLTLYRLGDGADSGRYAVDSLTQGPVLNGLLARDAVVDGQATLLLGFLSHQRQYRNPQTQEWEKASPALKAAYRQAVATMKKRLVTDEIAKYPIGPEALRLVKAGEATLQQYFTG